MKIKNLLCSAAAVSAFIFPAIANAEVEKAYTLTPVDSATDTSITLYEYDKDTKTLTTKHNELTLNKTTYGSGNASTTVDVVLPNNKTQTITINYDTSNLNERVTESNGQDINGVFYNNKIEGNGSYYSGGSAIKNQGILGNINADFINNSSNDGPGGAIANIDHYGNLGTTIGNITGNFIGNSIINSYASAIYNYNSRIGDIVGDFIGNYCYWNESNEHENSYTLVNGAAIYSEGKQINNIIGNFIGNYVYVTGNSNKAYGSAISFDYGGKVNNIIGDFISNYISIEGNNSSAYGGAVSIDGTTSIPFTSDFVGNHISIHSENSTEDIEGFGGAIYAHGKFKLNNSNFIKNYSNVSSDNSSALSKGGAIFFQKYNSDDIGNINANFVGNYTQATSKNNSAYSEGGAIYLSSTNGPMLEYIKGDFANNYAIANGSKESIAKGGAIYNGSTAELIEGNFIENYVKTENNTSSAAYGGAIYNERRINKITGDFIENKALSNNVALGGAIVNNAVIKSIEGDFNKNTAEAENGSAYGGAIANTTILADMVISLKVDDTHLGNYIMTDNIVSSTDLTNINATENKAISKNATANGGFLAVSGVAAVIEMPQHETTSSQEEHDQMVQGYQAQIQEMLQTGYIVDANDKKDINKISINNSTISKNEAVGKTGANGGSIYLGTIDKAELSYMNTIYDYYFDGEFIGSYYSTVTEDPDLIIPISLGGNIHIKDSVLQENIAKTSEGFAKGGAIAVVSNIDKDIILSTGEHYRNDMEYYWENGTQQKFETKEQVIDYIRNKNNKLTFEEAKEQFEITSPTTNINIENTSFFNNTAISENGTALGGAIYSDADLTITADGKDVTFAGNKTISAGVEDDNAIYLDKNAVVTFDIKNNAQVNMADNINGTDGFGITITGDGTGTFNVMNTIGKANLSLGNANINMLNNKVDTYELNTLTAVGNSNLYVDVDLANETMDKFTTTGTEVTHNGTINVAGMNLISDAKTDLTKIEFADSSFKDNVTIGFDKVGKGVDNKFQTTAYTPIYAYDVTYDSTGSTGNFVFKGGPSTQKFNPAVMTKPIAQSGAQNVQMDSYTEAFRNMDMFMLMPENERIAYKYRNKYAALTDDLVYDPTMSTYQNNTAWFRPYTTFEKVDLKNGPEVSNTSYGTYFGYDSSLTELGKGWDGTFGVYAGYNGSHQTFHGNSIYQNGGSLGVIGVAYKGNFFTGWTLNVGASAGSTSNMYGSDNFTSIMGGLSTKNGYNFEFADGKFILQPSVLLSYSLVNTFDYTNAAGVRMKSDPLHTLQIEPSIKLIGNIGTWQPYANVAMVWNILNETKVTANDVVLPEVSVRPYVKYGVGLQKKWADKFTAFGQCYVTNGGRNGVGLQAGLRIALGDETTKAKAAWLNPKKKDTVIVLDGKVK